MNIIYIDHYAGSKDYGRSFRPHYLGREWVQSGHNVTVVAGSFSHLRIKQPMPGKETIDGIDYIWLKTPKYNGNGIGRIFSMFVFMLKLFMYVPSLKKKKPNAIIASTVYMLDVLPAWILKKIIGAKLIFELHDLWPASPKELGGYSRFHPFILIMSFAEYMAYKLSDRVVSILPLTYSHAEKFGVKKENWSHVPNGIVAEEWDSAVEPTGATRSIIESIRSQYKNQFLVAYAGQIGLANGVGQLIKVAELLKDKNIHFCIFGDGSLKDELEKECADNNIGTTFFGKVPKSDIPFILELMDLLFVAYEDFDFYKYGVNANKLFDYMMSGKPVLQALTKGNDIISNYNCGVTVKSGDIDQMKKEIINFYNMNESERLEIGSNGKASVMRKHDYCFLAESFKSIL